MTRAPEGPSPLGQAAVNKAHRKHGARAPDDATAILLWGLSQALVLVRALLSMLENWDYAANHIGTDAGLGD